MIDVLGVIFGIVGILVFTCSVIWCRVSARKQSEYIGEMLKKREADSKRIQEILSQYNIKVK